ncbi:hypothetical protein DSO57_1031904 [Entomophthora muscae]|uniref:Uncharacterized protein n=1 Tax=Entomophthora muscae TaxID=34485 RepID=A0ACC2TBB1_9FUNG|nr:hypothetical protein DSO57_1031904 [Entomophthora muscae]
MSLKIIALVVSLVWGLEQGTSPQIPKSPVVDQAISFLRASQDPKQNIDLATLPNIILPNALKSPAPTSELPAGPQASMQTAQKNAAQMMTQQLSRMLYNLSLLIVFSLWNPSHSCHSYFFSWCSQHFPR